MPKIVISAYFYNSGVPNSTNLLVNLVFIILRPAPGYYDANIIFNS